MMAIPSILSITNLARVPRFELGTTVLETGMIPFHYTRVLSYRCKNVLLVELAGLEPATPCLPGKYSSQLSYSPKFVSLS